MKTWHQTCSSSSIGLADCRQGDMLVLGQGFTEAWYQLSKDEQEDLWAKVEQIEQRAGSSWLILCDSRWADEAVFDWAVIEYPDMDAYRRKVAELEKLNRWRYWSSSKTILGTKIDVTSPVISP
jgi:hypothetical protein